MMIRIFNYSNYYYSTLLTKMTQIYKMRYIVSPNNTIEVITIHKIHIKAALRIPAELFLQK